MYTSSLPEKIRFFTGSKQESIVMTVAPASIITPRLLLRHLEAQDFAIFHQILGDPRVGKWLGNKHGFTLADSKALWDEIFLSWEEEGMGPWAVVSQQDEVLMGYCGLRFSEEFEEIELMYALHPDYWGQGYMTEAAGKVLQTGFEELKLLEIFSFTLPENIASLRVMEKIGMEFFRELIYKGMLHVCYRKTVN